MPSVEQSFSPAKAISEGEAKFEMWRNRDYYGCLDAGRIASLVVSGVVSGQ